MRLYTRSYAPLWERIRLNPGKKVPVEVPQVYLSRLLKAIAKEKLEDRAYKNLRHAQKKTGIIYRTTQRHPNKAEYIVVTFILREYNKVLSTAERQSLVRREQSTGSEILETLEMVDYEYIHTTADATKAMMQMGTEIAAQNTLEGL